MLTRCFLHNTKNNCNEFMDYLDISLGIVDKTLLLLAKVILVVMHMKGKQIAILVSDIDNLLVLGPSLY